MPTKSSRISFLLAAVAIVGFMAGTFLVSHSRMPNPVFSKLVCRADGPHSGSWEEDFEVRAPIQQFLVQTELRGKAADLRLNLREKNGAELMHGISIGSGFRSFACMKPNIQGIYTIHVREEQIIGKYSIEISSEISSITPWQRFLFMLISLFALSGGLTAWHYRRNRLGLPAPALAPCRLAFLTIGMGLLVLALYLLLHEGGHALAAISSGSWDWSGSDFFGLRGSPHSGINPKVTLAGWQQAMQSIAGPLFPIFAAYLLYALGLSGPGKTLRHRSSFVDAFWCLTTLTFLASALGLLIPMSGLGVDSDYSGFVNSVPFPLWLANAFLLMFVVTSFFLVYRLWPSLPAAMRGWFSEPEASKRANDQTQETNIPNNGDAHHSPLQRL